MNQLWTVMYKFQFRLSPEYAMVVRALGSLEGTATTLDPGFQVVASAYPFIVGRLLADPDPQMRETLRELLIRNNGSIRWHRLERLVQLLPFLLNFYPFLIYHTRVFIETQILSL
jgi:aarF domain-containing kinase